MSGNKNNNETEQTLSLNKPDGWPSNSITEIVGNDMDINLTEEINDVVQQDFIDIAIANFMDQGFADGVTIPHKWFFNVFGIPEPTATTPYELAKDIQFRYMSAITKLKNALLVEHSIALKSVRAEGYAIVPPVEQPDWAKKCLDKELSESFRTATVRATFVRTDNLSDAERNAATATLASISTMRAHIAAARSTAKRRSVFN